MNSKLGSGTDGNEDDKKNIYVHVRNWLKNEEIRNRVDVESMVNMARRNSCDDVGIWGGRVTISKIGEKCTTVKMNGK